MSTCIIIGNLLRDLKHSTTSVFKAIIWPKYLLTVIFNKLHKSLCFSFLFLKNEDNSRLLFRIAKITKRVINFTEFTSPDALYALTNCPHFQC